MDTGLDAALSDSLDGMEYLYLIDGDLWLRRQTILAFKITPSRDGVP